MKFLRLTNQRAIIFTALIVATVAVITVTSTIAVMAQSITNVHFKTIGALGKGIAISATDPTNFKLVKVGVATLEVDIGGQTTETSLGVLFLEKTKYVLKNVVIGDGTFSGDVYSNDTKIGMINATLKTHGEDLLWFGTLTIDNTSWNIYLLEGQRKISSTELGEEAEEKCGENPQACNDVARGIGNRFCQHTTDQSCRDKIKQFCEQNPQDPRCVAMFRAFCKDNLDDTRCRDELKDFCTQNPDNDTCEKFCHRFPAFCGITTTTTTSSATTSSTSASTTTISTSSSTTTTIPASTTTTTTSASTTTTTAASTTTTTHT